MASVATRDAATMEVATLAQLLRAADAAGYAMAGTDDMFGVTQKGAQLVKKTAVEDIARGARPVMTAAAVAAEGETHLRQRIAHGAHVVRDSVYGYLGLGQPA